MNEVHADHVDHWLMERIHSSCCSKKAHVYDSCNIMCFIFVHDLIILFFSFTKRTRDFVTKCRRFCIHCTSAVLVKSPRIRLVSLSRPSAVARLWPSYTRITALRIFSLSSSVTTQSLLHAHFCCWANVKMVNKHEEEWIFKKFWMSSWVIREPGPSEFNGF